MPAIIFDFNGVLVWDTSLHTNAWSLFGQRLRGEPFSDAEIEMQVLGRTNRHIMTYLNGGPMDEAEIERLAEQKEQIYRQMCLDLGADFGLSPGAVDLLDWLALTAIPRTIATASGRNNLDFYIRHLNLPRWFDVGQIVYDDGSLPGKPAPDVYLKAAANLGYDPAECIVIEDSPSGIQAAHAAGIGRIIGLGPADNHARLQALPGVSLAIEHLGQFPKDLLA